MPSSHLLRCTPWVEALPKIRSRPSRSCADAAEHGLADAQYRLGVRYSVGLGVPQDFTEAATWLSLAAEHEIADAQLRLGLMYAEGNGVARDAATAVRWIRRAALQGLAAAQFSLGASYLSGHGVAEDFGRGGNLVPKCSRARSCRGSVQSRPDVSPRPRRGARHWRCPTLVSACSGVGQPAGAVQSGADLLSRTWGRPELSRGGDMVPQGCRTRRWARLLQPGRHAQQRRGVCPEPGSGVSAARASNCVGICTSARGTGQPVVVDAPQ